nr:hypothetical protein L204_01849 [Cryptococcus depauperatus CBS 7855]
MDVCQASDGGLFRLHNYIDDYGSIDELYQDVSSVTGVPDHDILLFLEDGRELKSDILPEIRNQAGPSYPTANSQNARIRIHMFNRETFWTDAEVWAAKYKEDIQLPPPLDLSSFEGIQHPFIVAHDHLSHLNSLFEAQSQSLKIAYSNIAFHLQPVLEEFKSFSAKVEGEFKKEEDLINCSRLDMTLITKLMINQTILKKKDEEGKVKTLGDYVNGKKMEQVRETCRVLHVENVDRYNILASQLDELVLQSNTETRAFNERSAEVENEFAEGLTRIEIALSQLSQLTDCGATDVEQDFVELDQAMRDDLVALTSVKNDFTFDVHSHLRQVATFQSQITRLIDSFRKLDAELSPSKDRAAFIHLERLHYIPIAYATAVSEIARRKEFTVMLNEWIKRLTGALNTFTQSEIKRRDQISKKWISQLPFTIPSLTEGSGPKISVTVAGGMDNVTSVSIGYEEVEKLVIWLEQMKNDPEVISVMEKGDEERLGVMQDHIRELMTKLDSCEDEFDKVIEKVYKSNMTQDEYEKRLQELQETNQKTKERLEEQHEQRMAYFQVRQGELQEELARLRINLTEESVARQGLTAELHERQKKQEEMTRDQQDHQNQQDMISALQAELAQEKDRATDLGVRLQEALLDVDGLKNAEHSLITQLQNLQEDRKKTLKCEREAQRTTKNMESQIAGLTAELKATTEQLIKAQSDRDCALRNQSAEAEKMMRDHIAEADGDRAVLEHQHLTLTKELEDLRIEMEKKLSLAQNASIRQIDGLKAELSLTKAQLQDMQRKEMASVDELAITKDYLNAMTQERTHLAEQAKDAVGLVARYHEICLQLQNAINMSTTISGTAVQPHSQSPPINQPAARLGATNAGISSHLASSSRSDLLESVSLVAAQNFDLHGFSESVTKTIGLVKKWSKSCRQYRDQARNKISFTNFAKGDLALFLPTRNTIARSWAAFNISAPHNFLKVDDTLQQQIKAREWIIARIIKTDESVALGGEVCDASLETNPFGLADGLRYYIHTVEEYNPSAPRLSRRSTSTSFPNSHIITPGRRSVSGDSTTVIGTTLTKPIRGKTQSGYFPPMGSLDEQGSSSDSPVKGEVDECDAQTQSPTNEFQQARSEIASPPMTSAKSSPPKSISKPTPPLATSPTLNAATIPPLRARTSLPTVSRDSQGLVTGAFNTRPPSVASSNSSYLRTIRGGPGPSGKTGPAPAMAVTTSCGAKEGMLDEATSSDKAVGSLSETPSPSQGKNNQHKTRASITTFNALGTSPEVGGRTNFLSSVAGLGRRRQSSLADGRVSAVDMLRKIDQGSGGNSSE